MSTFIELLLILMLLSDILLTVSSRLLHSIRLVAFQGLILALLPFSFWNWSQALPHAALFLTALLTLGVKACLLPYLLRRAMYKIRIQRELEPLVGYSASLLLFLVASIGIFFVCRKAVQLPADIHRFVLPTALISIFTGLFIIMARKKALTQILGFLVFENGMTLFGTGMMIENGLIVELGILLDVIVLVFIMGITLFNINREFSNIDSNVLHLLNDEVQQGGDK